MEKGYRWYQDGKLERKTNTFVDFIAAAEALRDAGYADPKKIAAQGGSAGGMLMGAIANMRPDLFAAIVADVPFVDVLNTMADATLPLTPPEWPEWGNPIESEEAYRTIAAYSPYDNVSAQDYPALLVTAGLTDPRVTYWEPAKWVAKLRATKTNHRPPVPAHQYGGRPCRCFRPIRLAERNGARAGFLAVGVRADGGPNLIRRARSARPELETPAIRRARPTLLKSFRFRLVGEHGQQ